MRCNMKNYLVEWETDYFDDFPERRGECTIQAKNEEQAKTIFYAHSSSKAIIINITERTI